MQAYAIDTDQPPRPGSEDAAKMGCTCARMDNHYGAGRGGDGSKYGWYISGGCPLHMPEIIHESKEQVDG